MNLELQTIDKINLMGEYLLIEPLMSNKSTDFILPKSDEKPTVARVLKVGNGVMGDKVITMCIAIGDVVIFNEWAAKIFINSGEEHFYIKQSDVIAYFKES